MSGTVHGLIEAVLRPSSDEQEGRLWGRVRIHAIIS
jgi:hypothetical protein